MSKENAIRSAANTLLDAIVSGREAGLAIVWPSRPEDLAFIAISETGKLTPIVDVAVPGNSQVPAEALAKAASAAQRVVDKSADKP